MKRYYKITTNTPNETIVNELSEPWILLDKSEIGKDNFIFQRSINNLTLDLCEGYDIDDVNDFVNRDKEHALMCIQNTDNTYTVIYKKEKTELSSDSIYQFCKNIILPNSITKINPETFKGCINLENITLPNSISEIGDGAFYGCKNLTIIKVPSRVTQINSNLFNSCENLTKAYIPNNIHYISRTAFNKCEKLTEVILYNELTNSEEHFPANENGEIFIEYYDENGDQKIININKEWELHELTPNNNAILYKTYSNNIYDFNTTNGYPDTYVEVEGYTINSDGSHSPSTKLEIVNHDEEKDMDGYYNICFDENTNISKISGYEGTFIVHYYFGSFDLEEIYLPVSVTDINNYVFDTPNLSTLLLPPNISLKQCKLPDNEEQGIVNKYIEVLHNCGKLKNILYNGTAEEFNKIINNSETASSTWYKDLPYKFTVTCLDKVLNFVNKNKTELIPQNDYEILYKAPLVANRDYTIRRVSTSIYITTSELIPTNDDYNILQFNYTSDKKKLNGYYEASNGGYECYCLQSDGITELVLPNGIEEIDALAFNCPNLTTITLPNSIKRFKTVRYTDVWSADLETINRTLIFCSNIETIYFNGTEYEWNAIDKNLNWNPEGKKVTVKCLDKEFTIEGGDNNTPYQMVDLGLPSGLIWADRNIGAETPQDNGLYFSWGNVEGHVAENGGTMYGYSFDKNTYNETLGSQYTGSELASTEYDAATANMGGEWHMPTIEDVSELVDNTDHYYIDLNGDIVPESQLNDSGNLRSVCLVKKDDKFIYNNRSNFIEFPFAGVCSGSLLDAESFECNVWTSSICKNNTNYAHRMNINCLGEISRDGALSRFIGFSVRGVRGPLEYKMVDLGLPSGLKWADRNVGADTPQDDGLFFSWGNVEGHTVDENGNTIDGYLFDEDTYATTTGGQYTGSELDIEHDAATVNMGNNWRMPTIDEISELVKNTDHYYIDENGSIVIESQLDSSIKLRSICFVKKDTAFDYNIHGNFIEIPFAGYCDVSLLNTDGFNGYVWSSSINDAHYRRFAYELYLDSSGYISTSFDFYRFLGLPVRGVYDPIEYNMVDLGLSVKWADRNVGAKTPQDNGLYFSWGNIDGHAVGKSGNTIDGYSFDEDTYPTTSGSKYTGSELDTEHDAATVNMGGEWRMPTFSEIRELVQNTYHYYIDLMGNIVPESQLNNSSKLRSVCLVKMGDEFNYNNRSNFIEIPFAGRCDGFLLYNNGLSCAVWTSSVNPYGTTSAYRLYGVSQGIIHADDANIRYQGLSVRGVYARETFEYQEIIKKQNTIIETLNGQITQQNATISDLTGQINSVTSKTVNSNGTFTAEDESVLGWSEIIVNVTATEEPEVPEVPEVPEEPEISDTTSTIANIYVMDETTDWTEITEDNYIQGLDCIRIEGTNLVTGNNEFNFSFTGNSTSDEIKDPNFTSCWLPLIKTSTVCELECAAGEKDGITLTPPYVSSFRYISNK